MRLQIGLFFVKDLPSEQGDLQKLVTRLPFGESEQKRLAGIRNSSALRQSLGGLLALESLLLRAEHSPFPIQRSPLGKPYGETPDAPCFSMTHSESLAAAVLGEVPSVQVGIDIERVSTARSYQKIAKRFFTAEEQKLFLKGGESPEVFYRLWTKKEALAKLHGGGLFADTPICAYTASFRLQVGGEIYFLTVAAENEPTELRWSHQIKELTIYEVQN